jgi:hypothetical protein
VEQTKKQLTAAINAKIQNISPRLEEFETAANEIEKTSAIVLKKMDIVQKDIETTSHKIAEQEKKITDTSELVRAIFAHSRTDIFEPAATPEQMVIIKHDDSHASVYLLLKEVPIEGTLQLQYHVFSQPKPSYSVLRSGDTLVNVVGFRWGENAATLTGKLLPASYIGDPTAPAANIKILSMKDERVYGDGVPLPYMFPQYKPKQ